MSVLRLYLRPGWPDSEPGLPWALLGSQGQCLDEGDGSPAAWPRADQLELVLPAGTTLFTSVALPAGRELKPAVIGYALEEQLANDPAANLYAVGGKLADGRRSVAVCEAAPVRRAVAMLRQLGRLADRIVPEETLLPLPVAGQWVLSAQPQGCLLRMGADAASFLPAASAALLLPRLAAAPPPAGLLVLGELPQGLPASWPLQQGDTWQWQHGRSSGPNFAQGELAADRQWRAFAPSLKRAGVIVAAVVLAQTLLACGQWGWYAWQKKDLQQQIRQQVQPWAPQAVAGSSALPMLRAVDRLRLSRGLPARDDMVEAMAQLAQINRGQLKLVSLRYDSGRLAFQAPSLSAEQAQGWQAQLAARQWLLTASQNEQGQREWVLTREPL